MLIEFDEVNYNRGVHCKTPFNTFRCFINIMKDTRFTSTIHLLSERVWTTRSFLLGSVK